MPRHNAPLARDHAGAHGDAHPNVAATMGNLATVLEHEARYAEAEKLYQQTLQAYERIFGPNHPTTAIGLNNLANVYAAQGRNEAAAGLQERVLAIYEKAFGPDSPDVGRALNNLANSYARLGRNDAGARSLPPLAGGDGAQVRRGQRPERARGGLARTGSDGRRPDG